jgi:integrase
MFNADNVRQGFFEQAEVEAVLRELPPVLTDIVRFVSLTGWRISEVLLLRWEQVDRRAREVRLPDTKNGRPRTLRLTGELAQLIERRWTAREFSAYVFHRRRGRPVSYGSYRAAFAAACEQAGMPGRWTHDFRRTVARNLRRAGVPESVCMSITGHETASVFRRYAIVDGRDQETALAAVETLLRSEERHNFDVTPKEKRSGGGA